MEIKAILRAAKSQLSESNISEVDAEFLLAHVLGLTRMDLHNPVVLEATLLGFSDQNIIEEQFFDLLDRRLNFEPLQYLTGIAGFRHLEIQVGPGVLVPRPESELLIDAVLLHIKNLPQPVSVVVLELAPVLYHSLLLQRHPVHALSLLRKVLKPLCG